MDSLAHSHEPADEEASSPHLRRRIILSAAAIVLVLLLVLTPPLINVSRLRHRISTSMSLSLGRPVHLDGVSLQVLPIPGLVLQNLVVSEDPAFGSEPAIRANKVLLTLRPSSLWRRQIEISSIRFEVDENGSGPSLNLVRNAAGHWNLESLLTHAAGVQTAPTEQSKAGPAPRFPYIEATNGRLNIKLGNVKQPLSLVDADFALWLPSQDQWRVRLVGKPARTDTNVADTGTVRFEGQLKRAAKPDEVPVELRGSWHNAPMGEASKVLTGVDANWRGTLNVDASLIGSVGAGRLMTTVHINDLRRADFVPPALLDLSIDCNGVVDAPHATVQDPSCVMATPVPEGSKAAGQVAAIADSADLAKLDTPKLAVKGLRLGMTNVANSYLAEWVRVFSQRVPAKASPRGMTSGSVVLVDPAGWQGEFHADLPDGLRWGAVVAEREPASMTVTVNGDTLSLSPLGLLTSDKLMVSGEATSESYRLRLWGEASAQQLGAIRSALPPFADGIETVVPELNPVDPKAENKEKPVVDDAHVVKLDATCTRSWGGSQSCTANELPQKPARSHRR
jgi:AsmA protein